MPEREEQPEPHARDLTGRDVLQISGVVALVVAAVVVLELLGWFVP